MIASVLELPDDDPRRLHLGECPRCASILVAYQAFMKAEPAEGSDPAGAEERLGAFIRSNINPVSSGAMSEGDAVETSGEDLDEDIVSGRFIEEESSPDRGFLAAVAGALFARPVWMTAALVVIAGGLVWWSPWTSRQPVLRGISTEEEQGSRLELAEPVAMEDGSLLLAWSPQRGADSYKVCLYNADLSEITCFEAIPGVTFLLEHSMVPSGAPEKLLWMVKALDHGDEIAISPPAALGPVPHKKSQK